MKAVLMPVPPEGLLRPIAPRTQSIPKMAIVALVKWMEHQGYTQDDYDYYDADVLLPTDDELADYLRRVKPSIVGLSGTLTNAYQQIKRHAAIIRKTCPDTWIVVGGHITASANVILARTEADICVIGDGEIPWVKLMDYVKAEGSRWNYEALGEIRGLTYHDDKRELHFTGYSEMIPSDELQLPDYELLARGFQGQDKMVELLFRNTSLDYYGRNNPRADEMRDRSNVAMMPTSKGCVARCTFCQRTFKGYKTIELQRIDEHLAMLREKFKVSVINIMDENFGSNSKFAREVAKLMKKHDIMWSGGGTRVSSVSIDDLEFFQENNCVGFTFGAEAGCQRTLDVMEKRFTKETVFEKFEKSLNLGMMSPLNFMTGMPGETEETAMETGRFIGSIAHVVGVHPRIISFTVTYALPFPGTPLYEYCQQMGIIGSTVDEEEHYLNWMSNVRANKSTYVNSNGAPISEVLFWDVLMAMEASRTYRELSRRDPREPKRFGRELLKRYEELRELDRESAPTNFINQLRRDVHEHVKDSPFLDSLPRAIVYPTLKYYFYSEYVLKRVVSKVLGHSYATEEFGTRTRIPDSYFETRPQRERSLRHIVMRQRKDAELLNYDHIVRVIRQGEMN